MFSILRAFLCFCNVFILFIFSEHLIRVIHFMCGLCSFNSFIMVCFSRHCPTSLYITLLEYFLLIVAYFLFFFLVGLSTASIEVENLSSLLCKDFNTGVSCFDKHSQSLCKYMVFEHSESLTKSRLKRTSCFSWTLHSIKPLVKVSLFHYPN